MHASRLLSVCNDIVISLHHQSKERELLLSCFPREKVPSKDRQSQDQPRADEGVCCPIALSTTRESKRSGLAATPELCLLALAYYGGGCDNGYGNRGPCQPAEALSSLRRPFICK